MHELAAVSELSSEEKAARRQVIHEAAVRARREHLRFSISEFYDRQDARSEPSVLVNVNFRKK